MFGCGTELDKDIPTQENPIIVPIEENIDNPEMSNEYITSENPCGEVQIHPLCDIRGGPGVYLIANNCVAIGAVRMSEQETYLLCGGLFDVYNQPPPEDFMDRSNTDECPVPGLCGDPPKPEVPYE